jgi:hypothetical protein
MIKTSMKSLHPARRCRMCERRTLAAHPGRSPGSSRSSDAAPVKASFHLGRRESRLPVELDSGVVTLGATYRCGGSIGIAFASHGVTAKRAPISRFSEPSPTLPRKRATLGT